MTSQPHHVTPLLAHSAVGVVLLEETGEGYVRAWQSPRWVAATPCELTRVKFDITRSLLDVEGRNASRFPEYRVLEVVATPSARMLVLYAPFSLDTLMVEHHNWTAFEIPSASRPKWEALADLSRHVTVHQACDGEICQPLSAEIGDLRAIDSDSFRYVSAPVRDVIEGELHRL